MSKCSVSSSQTEQILKISTLSIRMKESFEYAKQKTYKHMLQDNKKVGLVILLVNPTSALLMKRFFLNANKSWQTKRNTWRQSHEVHSTHKRSVFTKMHYKENVMNAIDQWWTVTGCHQENDWAKDTSTSKYIALQ